MFCNLNCWFITFNSIAVLAHYLLSFSMKPFLFLCHHNCSDLRNTILFALYKNRKLFIKVLFPMQYNGIISIYCPPQLDADDIKEFIAQAQEQYPDDSLVSLHSLLATPITLCTCCRHGSRNWLVILDNISPVIMCLRRGKILWTWFPWRPGRFWLVVLKH